MMAISSNVSLTINSKMKNSIKTTRPIISRKGRMNIYENGENYFKPYNENGSKRYTELFATRHGKLRATTNSIICSIMLPKDMSKECMVETLASEFMQMNDFILSRNTVTEWE